MSSRLPPPFATFSPSTVIQAAGDGYRIWLAPINLPSDDGRVIVDMLGAREGRLPLMFSDSEMGHRDAVHVGTFGAVQIITDTDGVRWAVTDDVEWDVDAEAVEARRMVDSGQLQGVSIHMSRARFADVCPDGDGGYTEVEPEDIVVIVDEDAPSIPVAFESSCDEPLWGAFDAAIAAATIVAIPAFENARIEPTTAPSSSASISVIDAGADTETVLGQELSALLAAHASLDTPPRDWFDSPQFGVDGTDSRLVYDSRHDQWGCPLTVTDDGRVYGHLALWRTCHTGYRDRCVTAPRGADMTPYHQCRIDTADGDTLAVGPLVVDEGHAPAAWSTDRVTRHYADTTLTAAYVRAGEDQHGIWVAGAISPRATPEMVETLRRHSLSGDWRSRDGRFELIAAVAVNSPGFPIPQVLVASGEPVGLITFGAPPPDEQPPELGLIVMALEQMRHMLDRISAAVAPNESCDDCDGDTAEATPDQPDVSAFLVDDLLTEL